jgi:hypothetical protein
MFTTLFSPLAHQVSETLPGPDLTHLLAGIDVAEADDHELLEMAAAAERLIAWTAAIQARAVGELMDRARSSELGQVEAEIGLRLGTTKWAAAKKTRLAYVCTHVPLIADNLRTGVLDVDKALALGETGAFPEDVRATVVDSLIDRADTLSHRQLAELVRRAEVLIDPDGAGTRHVKARTERHVRFDPADDAMAYLTAFLPADDAIRTWTLIDTTARVLRDVPGETRTLDQCRADTLVALTLGQLAITDTNTVAPDDGVSDGAAAADAAAPATRASLGDTAATDATAWRAGVPAIRVPAVQVGVIISASTLAGLDDLPGHLAGYGPVPPTWPHSSPPHKAPAPHQEPAPRARAHPIRPGGAWSPTP